MGCRVRRRIGMDGVLMRFTARDGGGDRWLKTLMFLREG